MLQALARSEAVLNVLQISGGEPTLHPGLPKLVAKLREAGWPVKLDTNGTRPEVLAGLLELNMLEAVSMDIKAPLEPLAYYRNSGVSADLTAVATSVSLLASTDIDVEFRTTVTPAHRNFRESWLIADDSAYMRLRNPERYEGYYEIDNKLECRGYHDEFIEMWEACEPDQNTRRLSL